MRLSAEVFRDRIDELKEENQRLLRYIAELEKQLEHTEPGLLKEIREYIELE